MARISRTAGVFLIAASFAALSVARAQNFQVDKWNIGGDGGTDYLTAEAGTGRVFVSRGTHVLVVDGLTSKVLGDSTDTPSTHGIGIAPMASHGFTTNGGDSTVTMFDLRTLAVIRKIKVPNGGLDGIMYDEYDNKIILTNHSRPIGTLVAIDPESGDIVGTAELEDVASGRRGGEWEELDLRQQRGEEHDPGDRRQDVEGRPILAARPVRRPKRNRVRPRERPYLCGLRQDLCRGGWHIREGRGDDHERRTGRRTRLGPGAEVDLHPLRDAGPLAHQDSPDKYAVVATVPTMRGAKTISVDPVAHRAYLFQPEYGPPPAPAPGAAAPVMGGRGGPRGPVIAAWFFAIKQ